MSTTEITTTNTHTNNDNAITTTTSSDPTNSDAPTTSVRKRTRATAEQLSVLEDTFAANVSPNSKLRKELSERLQMSERSIQIWFQNRRAKVKHMQKRAQMQMQQASIRAQLYHYHQQQYGMQPYSGGGGGAPIMPLPQQQPQQQVYPRIPLPRSSSVDSNSLSQQQQQHNLSSSTMSTPPASVSSSCTSSSSPSASLDSIIPPTHHLSYPLQDTVDFPDYLHGGPLSPSPSPHHGYSSSSYPPQMDPVISSSSSSMPSLVAVPDAGPTAMLATTSSSMPLCNVTSTPATTPPLNLVDQATVSPQDIWPSSTHHGEQATRSQSVAAGSSLHTKNGSSTDLPTPNPMERSLSNPPMTTIDPSNLMMNSASPTMVPTSNGTNDMTLNKQEQQSYLSPSMPTPSSSSSTTTTSSSTSSTNNEIHLNCTTLTIGTWHRFKLRASDLLCIFKNNVFEWQIEDAGCHFKMEIPLSSVASIDFVQENNVLADVHFDISESPSFYMETLSSPTNVAAGSQQQQWVQCSDFTEGKQASRFFRHSLKGVSQHLKQDLVMLMDQCPETRRWVRFVEQQPLPQPQSHYPSYPQQPLPSQQQHLSSSYYPTPDYTPHPLTTHDPMMIAATDFSASSPDNMAFSSSSSMYIPPTTPSAYWSSMYQMPSPQTPLMMGASNYLV